MRRLGDIVGKLKAEDVPIFTIPEQEIMQDFLRKQEDNSVNMDDICKETQINQDRFLEINQEISLHFRDKLAPKVFFKAMMKSGEDNSEEFKQFFLRPDVDLSCLLMSKVVDIRNNMKMLNSQGYQFLFDSWKKYRGY